MLSPSFNAKLSQSTLYDGKVQYLYNTYVNTPYYFQKKLGVWTMSGRAGIAGCIGSMDATHVACEKIPFDLKQAYLGYKQSVMARTYNLVCTNRRRILSTTKGHSARWNDKSLVRYYEIAQTLQNGWSKELDQHEFVLKERSNDQIIDRHYSGAWLLVNNGYL